MATTGDDWRQLYVSCPLLVQPSYFVDSLMHRHSSRTLTVVRNVGNHLCGSFAYADDIIAKSKCQWTAKNA